MNRLFVLQELLLQYLLREPEKGTRSGREVHSGILREPCTGGCNYLENGRPTLYTYITTTREPNLFEEGASALYASPVTNQCEWHLGREKSCNAAGPRRAG